MAYVKCRYVVMQCANNWCPWPEETTVDRLHKYECEGADEEGELVTCRFAEPEERYLEGEYKRVTWDGTLKVGGKTISETRKKTYYGDEAEEGIHYLEIDGLVYVTDEDDEETEASE